MDLAQRQEQPLVFPDVERGRKIPDRWQDIHDLPRDPAELAIRDKANLVLGSILLDTGDYAEAIPYFNRVRLDGPFSNQALHTSDRTFRAVTNTSTPAAIHSSPRPGKGRKGLR